jgi:hypothetical protein
MAHHPIDDGTCLRAFSRPRYFYGQLLDVRHFESEQEYFKKKAHMLNRLVSGFGVVCGLDVGVAGDDAGVVVAPGLALDKAGREIVVPVTSKRVPIEPVPPPASEESTEGHCDEWVHLVLCYEEHPAGPEPVLAGGCEPQTRCSPGVIKESYALEIRQGKAHENGIECQVPNLLKGNQINYRALVDWVSRPCDEEPSDACLTLANIRRPKQGEKLEAKDIEIWARPIVFGLDLLYELVLALTHEGQNRRSGKN